MRLYVNLFLISACFGSISGSDMGIDEEKKEERIGSSRKLTYTPTDESSDEQNSQISWGKIKFHQRTDSDEELSFEKNRSSSLVPEISEHSRVWSSDQEAPENNELAKIPRKRKFAKDLSGVDKRSDLTKKIRKKPNKEVQPLLRQPQKKRRSPKGKPR